MRLKYLSFSQRQDSPRKCRTAQYYSGDLSQHAYFASRTNTNNASMFSSICDEEI
uniref:Uncharacterized protein n=1 Tax=Anguilla anguilla TaxID=7936 RepID=A0A0E9Q5J3_ANGAN